MYSEISQSPKDLGLPKNLTWPKKVAKEIELWDTAWAEWDEAHATLDEKILGVKQANAKDAQALRDAVANGKPDPGVNASDKAEREVVYWTEVAVQARRKADKLSAIVWAAIQEHREDLIRDAAKRARDGAAKFQEDMKAVLTLGKKAIEDRQAAYEGLRFVNRLTDSSLTYDPSFPVEGSMSVPKSHETRPLGIATLLEKSLEVPSETGLESV
jgi:hypothetical protein